MLASDKTALLVIDIQGKLAQLMHEKESLFQNVQTVIQAAKILEIPILWAEQNPNGLGPTVPEIAELLDGVHPIAKTSFSCYGSEAFLQSLSSLGRHQMLLAGIETHVCVYQTAADLLEAGYETHVLADAVSSRTAGNKQIGLKKMQRLGAQLTSVETAVFEILRVAEGEAFKQIIKIFK